MVMRCPTLAELPPPSKTGWPWTEESKRLPDTARDGNPWPMVSIVTPSYNQAQFVEETIRSVLLQGYPNIEYIIIDGGSTDGTVDIIRRYEDRLAYWISEPDEGQSDAINKGWKNSSGDILAWINSDDTYCPETIRVVAEIFRENDDIVLVSGAGNTIDIFGKTVSFATRSPDINPYTMLKHCGGVPSQPSVFFRKRVLDEVGFLNSELHYVMDWEFWIRIGLYYRPEQLRITNTVLSNYREWPETKTNKRGSIAYQERRHVFDSIFRKFSCDRGLLRIRRSAYSASYRTQASCARGNMETVEAIKCLLRAWCLAPLDYNPIRELLFFLTVMIGRRRRARLKERLLKLLSKVM